MRPRRRSSGSSPFAEQIPTCVEYYVRELLQLGKYAGQVAIHAFDFQFDGIEDIDEVVILQVFLNQCCGLVYLSDAVTELGVAPADVANQLLKFLGLDLLHPLDAETIHEGFEFGGHEDEPVKVRVDWRESQNLAIERFGVEVVQERASNLVPMLSNGDEALMSTRGGVFGLGRGVRTVERGRQEIFAFEEAAFVDKSNIRLEAGDGLLVLLQRSIGCDAFTLTLLQGLHGFAMARAKAALIGLLGL